jgi:hypothetical protein
MVDEEVESILREIRERVLATEVASPSRMGQSNGNGAGDSAIAAQDTDETTTADILALIDSYLTTTARAWDRLPPLVSNRTGTPARLELWLKRHLKRATRWFTWEQVNFNAAVHHAIRDTLKVLSDYEQAVKRLRAEIRSATEARRTELERHQAETNKLRAEMEAQRAGTAVGIEAIEARLSERVSELLKELRARDERLLDEQRVCFKQLSLETSENAVLEDRARRKAEALLAELQRRIQQLEKKR